MNKTYQVLKNLPDNIGSVLIEGHLCEAGMPVPASVTNVAIEDCLKRNLIEEVGSQPDVPNVEQSRSQWRGKLRPVSKWNLNPVDLVGKTVTELNIMILEKDPDLEPFGDLQEAVELLSKDYEG